jgi:hypothetical protein
VRCELSNYCLSKRSLPLPRTSQQQVLAESSSSKASALTVLPFELSPEVLEQMQRFKEGSSDCNWVELTITKEVITLVGYRAVSAQEALQQYIDSESAR